MDLLKMVWVGMDESNHGRFPEIYVAVYSDYASDGKETKGLTKKSKGNIETILKRREFRYILFSREHGNLICDKNRFLIAACEFINYFNEEKQNKDITFILDGEYRASRIRDIKELLETKEKPKIILEPKADLKYPVVNKADLIARILHRKYATAKRIRNHFPENIITPRIEDYLDLVSPYYEEKKDYHNKRLNLAKRNY